MGEITSLSCYFYLSVATLKIIFADMSVWCTLHVAEMLSRSTNRHVLKFGSGHADFGQILAHQTFCLGIHQHSEFLLHIVTLISFSGYYLIMENYRSAQTEDVLPH